MSHFSPEYIKYITSDEWKRRSKAIRKARGKCQYCGSRYNLEAHHNTYIRLGRERDSDITVLCKSCHEKMHRDMWHDKSKKKKDILGRLWDWIIYGHAA